MPGREFPFDVNVCDDLAFAFRVRTGVPTGHIVGGSRRRPVSLPPTLARREEQQRSGRWPSGTGAGK